MSKKEDRDKLKTYNQIIEFLEFIGYRGYVDAESIYDNPSQEGFTVNHTDVKGYLRCAGIISGIVHCAESHC